MRVVKAPTLLARRVDHVDHVSVLGCSVVVVVDRALVYVLGRQRTFRIFCPPSSTATATSPGPCRDPHSNQSAPVILGISREIAETSQCRTRERDGIFVGLGLLRPIPGSAQQRDWQLEHSMGGDLHAPKGTKRRKRTGRREDDERSEERDGGRTNSSRAVLHVVSIDDVHVHAHRPMDPSIRSRTNSFVHSFIRPCVLLAEIWSPAGGFFADPKNWRRNTVVAAVGIATVAAFIFKKSTSIEERHALPNHAIPSQRFAPQSFPRT